MKELSLKMRCGEKCYLFFKQSFQSLVAFATKVCKSKRVLKKKVRKSEKIIHGSAPEKMMKKVDNFEKCKTTRKNPASDIRLNELTTR